MVPSRVVIEVLGTFDEDVAHAVRAALTRGVERITIDFSQAAHADVVALARLARELARDGDGAVIVEGLSSHHERLLRYLGARLPTRRPRGPDASA